MSIPSKLNNHFLFSLICLCLPSSGFTLELEPRLWSHLPIGVNFGGVAYSYTEADIDVDPVLLLENVNLELHTWGAKYIRTFEVFDKSARVDFTQGYQEAEWQGLLDGSAASTNREGMSDSFVRFAINLSGSPPLKGKKYMTYRAGKNVDTVVGVGVVIRLPTGNYQEDKLLNLSGNRFVYRPQFGVSHRRGNWTTEVTSEVAFYAENDEFFNGNKLEQDPLYLVHGHLIYTFRPGLWLGASAGYGYGGESRVNGIDKNDKKQDIGWRLSAAYPINRQFGLKFAYTNSQTRESTGLDLEIFLVNLTYMW